ncbi:hypothetical protein ACXIUS_10910 [Bosea thiooxidans]
MDMLSREIGDEQELGRQQKEACEERDRLRDELATLAESPATISLHPKALARYEEKIADLQRALGRGERLGEGDHAKALRDLVESVTVYREERRSERISIMITGRLSSILAEGAYSD